MAKARKLGHSSLQDFVRKVKTQIDAEIMRGWAEISSLTEQHPYWFNRDPQAVDMQARRRAALATLLSRPNEVAKLSGAEAWRGLHMQVTALFKVLEVGRCYFLHRGTVEAYFGGPRAGKSDGKPAAAASEAETFPERQPDELTRQYADLYRCLRDASRARVARIGEPAMVKANLSQEAHLRGRLRTLRDSGRLLRSGIRPAIPVLFPKCVHHSQPRHTCAIIGQESTSCSIGPLAALWNGIPAA
jgi:hypothetical protein